MSTQEPTKSSRQIWFWPLLTVALAVVVFCIADLAMREIIRLKTDQQREKARRRLESVVERHAPFVDSGYAMHCLLRAAFREEKGKPADQARLASRIAGLRRAFPGRLRFVAWDKGGQVISSLSDQTSYRYLLRQGHTLIKRVTGEFQGERPGAGGGEKEIGELVTRLTPVFGELLAADSLDGPLRSYPRPGPVLASADPARRHIWFHAGESSSILCFLHRSLTSGAWAIDRKIAHLRRSSPHLRLGLTKGIGRVRRFGTGDPALRRRIDKGLAFLLESGEEFYQDERILLFARRLNSGETLFAWCPQALFATDADAEKYKFRRGLLIAFIPLVLLGMALTSIGPLARMSIRVELAFLFLVSNLLPMMVLGAQGLAYYEYKRLSLIQDVQTRLESSIRAYDQELGRFRSGLDERLRAEIGRLGLYQSTRRGNDFPGEALKKACMDFRPSFAYLIASGGNAIWEISDPGERGNFTAAFTIFSSLGRMVIRYLSAPLVQAGEATKTGSERASEWETFLADIVENAGKTAMLNVVGEECWMFWSPVAPPGHRNHEYMLMIGWSAMQIDRLFLDETRTIRDNLLEGRFYAISDLRKSRLRAEGGLPFQDLPELRKIRWDRLDWQGSPWVGVGLMGSLAKTVAYIALTPATGVDETIAGFKARLAVLIVTSLGLMILLALGFADKILAPVRELSHGLRAMGQGRLDYRVPALPANEFGRLGEMVNQTMESLMEREIAGVVQQALMPREPTILGPFVITGRSQAMMHLGGDFFDVFPLSNGKCGVFIGDVAGHGAQAALIMAMAKTSFLITARESEEPLRFLEGIHQTLFSLRSKRVRTMMTGLCLLLDPRSMMVTFAQAGQNTPLKIIPTTRNAEFLAMRGTPMGATKRANFQIGEFPLLPGEKLLLYSDGVVEAPNAQGEPYNYERFRALAAAEGGRPGKDLLDRVFAEVAQWSPAPNDDITVLVIERTADSSASESVPAGGMA